jgi:mannose-6-phosphate isomerase-like protein (cupin superfamily)
MDCVSVFEVLSFKLVDKAWGWEYWIVNNVDAGYCSKGMVIDPGHEASLHRDGKDETFVVLSGRMVLEKEHDGGHVSIESVYRKKYTRQDAVPDVELDGYLMSRSHRVRILPGTWHRFACVGAEPCIFLEISTAHKDEDVERWPGELSR